MAGTTKVAADTSTHSDTREAVATALAGYEELDAELRERLVDYLVTGDDATCLLDLPAAYKNKARKRFFKEKWGSIQPLNEKAAGRLQSLLYPPTRPPGYYQRLGEFASRIPELTDAKFHTDPRIPAWLQNCIKFYRLLRPHAVSYGRFYGGPHKDDGLQLGPLVAEFERAEMGALIAATVSVDLRDYQHPAHLVRPAGDWSSLLKQYPAELIDALTACDASQRELALDWLVEQACDFQPLLPTLADFATGASSRVRSKALGILRMRKSPDEAGELLAERLTAKEAGTRLHAAEALASLLGEKSVPHLHKAVEGEKGKRVKETLAALIAGFEVDATAAKAQDEEPIELPPIEFPEDPLPLPPEFVEAFWAALQDGHDQFDKEYEEDVARYNGPDRPRWMSKPRKTKRTERKQFDEWIAFMEGRLPDVPKVEQDLRPALYRLPVWGQWAGMKSLHLLHVARFVAVCLMPPGHRFSVAYHAQPWIESHRNARDEPYGLRELSHALSRGPDFEPTELASEYLQQSEYRECFQDWEADAVWPLFAEHADLLRDAIVGTSSNENDYQARYRHRGALRVAAMMPRLSRDVEQALWQIALGEAKTDRPLARRALRTAANRTSRAVEALGDGRQGVRVAAAEMVAELGDPEAVPPLKQALRKEKQEVVKGSLLQAIERLGGDVEEFLGRKKLLAEAKKGLEKKRPKGMEWVPLDALPTVRWADDDKPVAPEIVEWWVVQSIQFKLPTPGAILKRAIDLCRKDDAAALANYLLATFIAYDTKTPTRDEVVAVATKEAARDWNSPYATYLHEAYKTEEAYRDVLLAMKQNTFLQSAIGQKGMLAIVAAAGDAQSVKTSERYIRNYGGQRLAQSKALLETLGWIDHPSAVQVLLSLGNRFRTNAIRKRAAEMVDELAERQGWTLDQLADRSLPDAGFARPVDEEGNPVGDRPELVLDYGPRRFRVILGDDLQPVITRDDGKPVKSLPAAAKDDDPELVKEAKKDFSAAKKTVKETVKALGERLYEAACVQRQWAAEEWRRYLLEHPIAGALCRRVVWAAHAADDPGNVQLFRPLEDGTLSDVQDEEFTLADDAVVSVAHSSILDDETEQAWKQHLADYEVPTLFPQFGRPSYRLPEDLQDETDITDFRGHMLTTFQLRGKATKLGWERGAIEDGGGFGVYHKPFRSQRLHAVLAFTGSYVPESDIPAGICELYFTPIKDDRGSVGSWQPSKMRLGKVPAVLLSECYNDVRDIAAVGTGFDPEWQKKGLGY